MPKRRASVRGLSDTLKSQGSTALKDHPIDTLAGEDRQVLNIPISAIQSNPDQPRKHFDERTLQELANSIQDKGLLQPVIVKRLAHDQYLLVAGERRHRAAQLAGLTKIPALVTDGDELELAIIENLQREDLKPIEEAEALQGLAGKRRYTQEELATVVGKSRVAITESLSLLGLPDPIKDECRTSDIASKSLLLQVVRTPGDEKRLALWEAIKTGGMTVRAARKKDQRGRPKHARKTFSLDDPAATVTVRLKSPSLDEAEILKALQAASKHQEENMSQHKEN
jgi:ParB family chromosome partitioning protein